MSDPLNTPKDAKMEPNRDEILQAAAKGNASALEFLRVFARRAHWVDDLVDAEFPYRSEMQGPLKGVECKYVAESEMEWLLCLSANQFFLAHRAQLVPAMLLALTAWVDSNAPFKFKHGGGQEQEEHWYIQRDVIKGQWHEVVWLVAFLVGGTEHLRTITAKFRSYDFEEPPQTRNRFDGPHLFCYVCKKPLTLWSCTMFRDGSPHPSCKSCYEAWAMRPTLKEPNGLPGK